MMKVVPHMADERESFQPKQVKMVFVGDENLPTAIVTQPFVIELIPREGGYLATSDISNAYELGATAGQALRNYLEFLADELLWLQKNEKDLSPSIQEDLRLLQCYLQIV